MKICAAQMRSTPGDIEHNLLQHVALIEQASAHSMECIFFPELSLTGYEPTLAQTLAMDLKATCFDMLQTWSDQTQMTIAVGAPLQGDEKPRISMIFFRPQTKIYAYSKQILHEDELPYFEAGTESFFVQHEDELLAPAICYESMQPEHAQAAKKQRMTVYCCSVAKHHKGVEQAHTYYSKLAKQSNVIVLMANSYGMCDDFLSDGNSAVWDMDGTCRARLPSEADGWVGFDTKTLQPFTQIL